MDNLRFVLESPQLSQAHKKRPRLVTSCDNCRLKKIKCVQLKSIDRCEACDATNVACQFRDRERYFAERSRIVTGASAGPSAHRRSSTPGIGQADGIAYASSGGSADGSSEGHSWAPSGMHSHALEVAQSRYSSNSPAPYGSSPPQVATNMWLSGGHPDPHRSGYERQHYTSPSVSSTGDARVDTSHYAHSVVPSGLPQSPPGPYSNRSFNHRDSQLSPLFDPRQPNIPHPTLMSHLVQVFFDHFGRNFLFLQYDDIAKRLYNGTLSPLLANSIAALSSRYSQSPEVLGRGVSTVVDAYCNNAEHLLSTSSHIPYVEILHSVIFIAWAEYKSGRTSGFYEYSQMATKMALSLGLDNDSNAQTSSDRERTTFRATWASVMQLQQLTSSLQGTHPGTLGR